MPTGTIGLRGVTSDDPQRPTLGEDDAGGGRLAHVLEIQTRVADVAQVKTPTLLVQGENDNDVPIAEAEQFYIGLKDVGVETAMLRYPRAATYANRPPSGR